MITQAQKYADLSPCNKRKVGCVVVKDGKVISYGFNHGYHEKCSCSMEDKNPHVLHAEQMALCGEDREVYKGATLYVTYKPCDKCEILIKQCEIKEVFYLNRSGEVENAKCEH